MSLVDDIGGEDRVRDLVERLRTVFRRVALMLVNNVPDWEGTA